MKKLFIWSLALELLFSFLWYAFYAILAQLLHQSLEFTIVSVLVLLGMGFVTLLIFGFFAFLGKLWLAMYKTPKEKGMFFLYVLLGALIGRSLNR